MSELWCSAGVLEMRWTWIQTQWNSVENTDSLECHTSWEELKERSSTEGAPHWMTQHFCTDKMDKRIHFFQGQCFHGLYIFSNTLWRHFEVEIFDLSSTTRNRCILQTTRLPHEMWKLCASKLGAIRYLYFVFLQRHSNNMHIYTYI